MPTRQKQLLILSLLTVVSAYSAPLEKTEWKKILPNEMWRVSVSPDLEDVLNVAELYLNKNKPKKAIDVYKLILENVPKQKLTDTKIDGCSAEFLVNAGICRAGDYAEYKKREALTSNDYCLSHGKYAYELVLKTPYSCNNIKRLEKLLWALASLSNNPNDKNRYSKHVLKLSSARGKMQSEKRVGYAWNLFVHGKTIEAGSHFDAIINENPRLHPSAYEKAGIVFTELEDYRKAVKCWLAGMKLMRLNFFGGCAQDSIREIRKYLPYLTKEEIEEFLGLIRRLAARNPALAKNVSNIAQWLNLANDPQFQFELKLRELEKVNSDETTNMLLIALEKYKHPEYARKLKDTQTEFSLYCNRLNKENHYFRLRYYMRKLNRISDKIESTELKKYRDALEAKVSQYNPEGDKEKWYPELIEEMKQKIKELDIAHPEWYKETKS